MSKPAQAQYAIDIFQFVQWGKQIQSIQGMPLIDLDCRRKILAAAELIPKILEENTELRRRIAELESARVIESRNHSQKLATTITTSIRILRELKASPDDWIAELPTGINCIAQLNEDQARKYILDLRKLYQKLKKSLDSSVDGE